MLKLNKNRRVIDTVAVGTVTILEYDIFNDGTSSKPRLVKSYNFVPTAEKKKKKVKEKKKIQIQEEEGGLL